MIKTAEKWTLGGYHTDVLTGKVVKFGMGAAALNASGVCFKVAGVDYQVTAGKTFYITGFMPVQMATGNDLAIRYADNAALTTNPVTIMSLAAAASPQINPGDLNQVVPLFGVTAPATKYVGLWSTGVNACCVFLLGYEV